MASQSSYEKKKKLFFLVIQRFMDINVIPLKKSFYVYFTEGIISKKEVGWGQWSTDRSKTLRRLNIQPTADEMFPRKNNRHL